MEITSFVLGMLTVVAVIFVAVIVAGVFKIKKLGNQLVEFKNELDWRGRNHSEDMDNIHDRISRMDENAYRQLEDFRRELDTRLKDQFEDLEKGLISYTDSRIDKLQSKSKEAQVK